MFYTPWQTESDKAQRIYDNFVATMDILLEEIDWSSLQGNDDIDLTETISYLINLNQDIDDKLDNLTNQTSRK